MKANSKTNANPPNNSPVKNIFAFKDDEKPAWLPLVIAFGVPVLLYMQTLWFGLTWFDDDKLLLNNIPFLSNFHNLCRAFLTDAYDNGSSHYYRPLQTVSYMMDMHIGGEGRFWIFHLTNMLLAGCMSCLLFLLLRKFAVPIGLALLSTHIYVAHPLFVSNIAYIPTRGDLLLLVFFLTSFLCFIEYMQNSRTVYLLFHWITFSMALFCKETAAFFPVVFVVYYLFFREKKQSGYGMLLVGVMYIVSLVAWYCIRLIAIGGRAHSTEMAGVMGQSDHFGLLPVLSNWRTIPDSLSVFFVPWNIAPIPSFTLFNTILGMMIIVVIGLLLFKNKARPLKHKLFCLFCFLVTLLPTMLYHNELIVYLNHRLFLPMIGILLFLLLCIPENRFSKNKKHFNLMAAIIFIVFATVSFINSRSYSDPLAFYDAAICANPRSAIACNNRGVVYRSKKRYTDAIADYSKAIALKPEFSDAYYNRGIVWDHEQDFDKAIADYTQAIKLAPWNPEPYNNRGIVYGKLGRIDEAIADFTKAIGLVPSNAEIYNNRGTLYGKTGSFANAVNDFTTAIKLKPDDAEAYNNRGITYERNALYAEAIADFAKALALKGDYAEAYNNRGVAYYHQGFSDNACMDFEQAERLGSEAAKGNLEKFCNK